MSSRISRCLCLVLLAALGACQRNADSPPPRAEGAQTAWSAFRDEFIEAHFAANPAFAVDAGRHEFDGRLPDWSAAGIAREIERLRGARERAAGFADETLSETERFERDVLLARIDRDLFWLDVAAAPFQNPAYYLDNGLSPSPYLTREYAPLEKRLHGYIGYAREIPRAARQIRENLQRDLPLALPLLERGVSGFRGFADFYRDDVLPIFAPVQDTALQAELREANAAAEQAMRELATWLESQRRMADQSFALGPERFARMLRDTERVTTPLDELEAIGRADLERNLAALRAACAELTPRRPIGECIARVSQDKPEGGPVQAAREQLGTLKQFVVERGLVSIPSDEEARVDESPPYARANSAYIDIPGPYERNLPATYYISPPDPSWSPAEQREYIPGVADLLFTSVHEVWPGHFLQFLHSNRTESLVGRLFVTYAFAEGWAHYTEELMVEAGLGEGDPEIRVGQLLNALLRNVRFLSAIGLHTRGMTVEESERLFREQAFADPGNARQQAARGTYDPAYLNYTMGKLMIRRLRDDWSASRGGRAAWREFHDAFLSLGGPPIPLARARMLGAQGPLF